MCRIVLDSERAAGKRNQVIGDLVENEAGGGQGSLSEEVMCELKPREKLEV